MFIIVIPENVTRKAINPPKGKDGPNEVSKAVWSVRKRANPANVIKKAVGVEARKSVTSGEKIPKIIAKNPSSTAADQWPSREPLETKIAFTGPVRQVETLP